VHRANGTTKLDFVISLQMMTPQIKKINPNKYTFIPDNAIPIKKQDNTIRNNESVRFIIVPR
jgi:hypothetical protein